MMVEEKAYTKEQKLDKPILRFCDNSFPNRIMGENNSGKYILGEEKNFLTREQKTMENDKILETYISKVDRDQSDLRNDIRESERRTQEKISKVEERMDDRLNRIEDMINKQVDAIGELKDDVNNKMDELKDDVNNKMDELKDDVNNKMDEHKRFMWGITLTTIIGIAAIVIAVIVK